MSEEFDLKRLCHITGVTPRTVHYYIQQGLLPPAGSSGPGVRYGEGHLSRLQLIRLLQKQHLPLAEIARRLKSLSDDEAAALVSEARHRPEPVQESALEYIRGVLSEQDHGGHPASSPRAAYPLLSEPRPHSAHRAFSSAVPPEPARSQWDRFILADGIELSVRRPLTRLHQRQLSTLLVTARRLLGSDKEE